jgi:predicted nucleic acid-binding protein
MLLLDTNVISELRKPDRARPKVLDWARRNDPASFFLSAVTLLEIQYGALLVRRRDKPQGDLMLRWVANDILVTFKGRILPVDEDVALRSAALHVPNPRPDRDAYIAATALVHDLTVVTRNTRDFEPTGVKLLNPWET